MFKSIFRFLLVAFTCSFVASAASGQTSIDDIEAALGGKTDELARVDAILSSADADTRIAGMQLLLESGNPTFVRRAKEVGLFSSDPSMRDMALKSVLDAGGALTFELNTSGLNKDQMEEWLDRLADQGAVAADGSRITLSFQIGPYVPDDNCYVILNAVQCLLVREGSSVALNWYFYHDMQGRMTLDPEGRLVGELTFARNDHWQGTVPIIANLMN